MNTRFHEVFADFIVAVQHPDKIAFVAHLQCCRWDHHRVFFRSDQHASIDELVREQGVILIVKARFHLDGARRRVNLVIQAQQRTITQFCLVGAIPGFDRQRLACFLGLNDGCDFVFGQRKDQVDRMSLGDHYDTRGITA
ncbi:hypothetical protein D3C78_1126400 [compost metagenome]